MHPFCCIPMLLKLVFKELPAYLAKAADVFPSTDELEWRKAFLPAQSKAAEHILLLQPESLYLELAKRTH